MSAITLTPNAANETAAAYASQAALALAQLYSLENKDADAEKLLDNLVKHPSVTVSKDEAELALIKVVAKTDPAKARKRLEDLQARAKSAAVSKAAVSEMAELMGRNN